MKPQKQLVINEYRLKLKAVIHHNKSQFSYRSIIYIQAGHSLKTRIIISIH